MSAATKWHLTHEPVSTKAALPDRRDTCLYCLATWDNPTRMSAPCPMTYRDTRATLKQGVYIALITDHYQEASWQGYERRKAWDSVGIIDGKASYTWHLPMVLLDSQVTGIVIATQYWDGPPVDLEGKPGWSVEHAHILKAGSDITVWMEGTQLMTVNGEWEKLMAYKAGKVVVDVR